MHESLAREASPLRPTLTLPEVFALVNGDLQEVESRLATVERPDVPMTAAILDHVLSMQGKRVRPLLAFAAGELSHADPERVALAGAAVEIIHAYSLVHGDLPCMNDDVLRRGKPTCHVEYDQATALLVRQAILPV